MTSIAQFFDINDDPFIVQGRKLIESMKIQVDSMFVVQSPQHTILSQIKTAYRR